MKQKSCAMKFTDEQVEALWESAEHWLNNFHKEFITLRDISPSTCVCCNKWLSKHCVGCPIRQFTGHVGCAQTSYIPVGKYVDNELITKSSSRYDTPVEVTDKLRLLIEEEYIFLICLAFGWYDWADTHCEMADLGVYE